MQGFPRWVRLTRAEDFETALRKPDFRIRRGPLHLNAVFTRMRSARLGLVVGKKAIPQANQRNRVKRIIRDRFRRSRAALTTKAGSVDLVFRVTAKLSSVELDDHLEALLDEVENRLGNLNDDRGFRGKSLT